MDLKRNYRIKGAIGGFLVLMLFSQVARVMADELIPSTPTDLAQPSESPTPTATPSPTATESPSPSSSPETLPPSPTPGSDSATTTLPASGSSPSPSPTPIKIPPHAIANQSLVIHTPRVVFVDPRAHSVALPAISATGSEFLLACVYGGGVALNTGASNQLDAKLEALFSGEGSQFIRSSGISPLAVATLNSGSGLRASSLQGSVAGKSITYSFVAVSEPTINPALCNDGNVSNNRTIEIQALGLGIDMKQADVRLKK